MAYSQQLLRFEAGIWLIGRGSRPVVAGGAMWAPLNRSQRTIQPNRKSPNKYHSKPFGRIFLMLKDPEGLKDAALLNLEIGISLSVSFASSSLWFVMIDCAYLRTDQKMVRAGQTIRKFQ